MSFPAQPYNNPHFNIKVTHIPTSRVVTFDGWVTNFQDSFSSEWNETSVYGRMDPLATFQRTGRKIQLAFDVVARSQDEAALNDSKINTLIQFLYPVYAKDGAANDNVMTSAPLLKLKWANLAANSGIGYGTGVGADAGLVGYLAGLDYSPNMAAGTFFSPPVQGEKTVGDAQLKAEFTSGPGAKRYDKLRERWSNAEGASKREARLEKRMGAMMERVETTKTTQAMALYHQQISLNLNFTVLHTHLPGWAKGDKGGWQYAADTAGTYNFPHGGATRQEEYFPGERENYAAQAKGFGAMTTNTPGLTTNPQLNEIAEAQYERDITKILKGPGSK